MQSFLIAYIEVYYSLLCYFFDNMHMLIYNYVHVLNTMILAMPKG